MSIDQDQRPGVAAVLDDLGPGPELDGLLQELSPAALTGDDLAAYLRAAARQQARADARVLTAMHHLGRARAGTTERYAGSDEFSGDEVAAVLCWSRTMATRKLGLADDLEERLPALGDALWEGRIDLGRATRFCEWTSDLPEDLARRVCAVLLPEAPGLPFGELTARIEQVAIELDPDWAARREARAQRNGRLLLTANPSGTATLSLCDVSAPSGLAMRDRVDALAAAVRGLGVLTPIGGLRTEVAERLLDGSVEGLDDPGIALLLAAEYHAANGSDGDAGPMSGGPDEGPDDGGPGDDGPGDDGLGDDGPRDPGPDSGPDGGPDSGPDGGPDGGPGGGSSDSGDRGPDAPSDSGSGDGGSGDGGSGDGGSGIGPGDGRGAGADDLGRDAGLDDREAREDGLVDRGEGHDPEQGVLDLPGLPPDDVEPFPPMFDGPEPGSGRLGSGVGELRLRLTTALGLDDIPARVPGYGTILAGHARTLLHRYRHGEWRIVGTDDQGRLQHVLLARRRPGPRAGPAGPAGAGARCRAIVELQVPTTLLAALHPADHGRWAPLISELQRRLAARTGGPPPETFADALRRLPRPEVRRWLLVRDRHCIAPACRRAAHRADIDHTRDHGLGGPTLSWNLGVLDRHHHRAKHHGGWTVRQPAPGRFAWRTRAGVHQTTLPKKILEEPVAPYPAARPRPLREDITPGWDGDDEPGWRTRYLRATGLTTPTHTTPAPTPPAVHPDDDPPPF